MYSLLRFLLVPVLVFASVRDDKPVATNQYSLVDFKIGSPDHISLPDGSYKGTLKQKRDKLIKPYLPENIVRMYRRRSVSMLDQIMKFYASPSLFRVIFEEDCPTTNRKATFREYLSLLSNDLLDPKHGLFTTSVKSDTEHSSTDALLQLSHAFLREAIFTPFHTYSECRKMIHIGQMIGNAILNKHFMDVSFMPLLYKLMLNKQIYWSDIKAIQSDVVRQLDTILNTDLSLSDMNIIWDRDSVNIPVTNENKDEYVKSEAENFYKNKIKPPLDYLLYGISTIIPIGDFAMFNMAELNNLISGETIIDPQQWRKHTRVSIMSYVRNWHVITWFWECVNAWDDSKRRQLLMFVTGMFRLPVGGFEGAHTWRSAWFNIAYSSNKVNSSPYSDPYKNVLYLPSYTSFKIFKEILEYVVMEKGTIDIWNDSATHLRQNAPISTSDLCSAQYLYDGDY